MKSAGSKSSSAGGQNEDGPMPATISFYIARQFISWFGGFLLVATVLVLTIDSLELVRRAASHPAVDMIIIAQMAIVHLPHVLEISLPFAMLFAAMGALWQLSRHQELAVARAAGLSIWQLLLPGLLTALMLGLLKIGAFNPLAAAGLSAFQDMEVRYLGERPNSPLLNGGSIWLKDYSGPLDMIVYGKRLNPASREIDGITIFQMVDNDSFHARIDAARGFLEGGAWLLEEVRVVGPDWPEERLDRLQLSTALNWTRVEKSLAAPANLPFWKLPVFIRQLEEAGFSAASHRVHYYAALAAPLSLCAMVLIAASFAIRPPRHGSLLSLIALGASVGIGYYIFSQVFLRLGHSEQIPALLSAWAPTGCALMLGAAWLLHTEDG